MRKKISSGAANGKHRTSLNCEKHQSATLISQGENGVKGKGKKGVRNGGGRGIKALSQMGARFICDIAIPTECGGKGPIEEAGTKRGVYVSKKDGEIPDAKPRFRGLN